TRGCRRCLIDNEKCNDRVGSRRVKARKWNDLNGSRRQILKVAIGLELVETARLKVIFVDRTVAGIAADEYAMRRFIKAALTHETDLATQFFVGIVDKDDSCLPSGSVRKMRNNNWLIDRGSDVRNGDRAKEGVAPLIRKKPESRNKHRQRGIKV